MGLVMENKQRKLIIMAITLFVPGGLILLGLYYASDKRDEVLHILLTIFLAGLVGGGAFLLGLYLQGYTNAVMLTMLSGGV